MGSTRKRSALWTCLLLAGHCSFAYADKPPDNSDIKTVVDARTGVSVTINDAALLGDGRPACQLTIKGWEPNGIFSAYVVDSDGNKITISSEAHYWHADADGVITTAFLYQANTLHMGRWTFVVAGKPGSYEARFTVPKLIYPQDNGGVWRLDFDAAEAWEKDHKTH